MMYLFGSWARGEAGPKSDVDLFVESAEDLAAIPPGFLLGEGGVVDAFAMEVRQYGSPTRRYFAPVEDVALAIKSRAHPDQGDDRRLVVWDKAGSCVGEPIPLTLEQLLRLCALQSQLRAGQMSPAVAVVAARDLLAQRE